ncbi:MAG: hypothetical protein ACJ76K_17670, partial [Solirubrobacteraceae bacterium]
MPSTVEGDRPVVAARGDAANSVPAGEVAGAVAIVEPPLAALGEAATLVGAWTPVEAETVEPVAVEALPATDPVPAGPVTVVPVVPPRLVPPVPPMVPVTVVSVVPPRVVPPDPPMVPVTVVSVEPPTLVPPPMVPVTVVSVEPP